MKTNRFCSYIYNKQITSGVYSLAEKIFSKIRHLILRKIDPPVYVGFSNEKKIYMPFSHELPMYKKHNPKYMKILRILAENINGKLNCLDIGANIGDSVLEMGIKDAKYLLIEGDHTYSKYIGYNLGGRYDYKLIETYLGSPNENIDFVVEETKGTAKLKILKDKVKNENKTQTVDEIIMKHAFKPNLIKLCADGFEIKILRGACATLEQYHPTLFLQWCPSELRKNYDDPLEIFTILKEYDVYHNVKIYDNFGFFLMDLDIDEVEKLENLCSYQELGGKINYYYIITG